MTADASPTFGESSPTLARLPGESSRAKAATLRASGRGIADAPGPGVIHQRATSMPPTPTELGHLVPRDAAGWAALGACGVLTAAGLALATARPWLPWSLGQVLLAVAFVQWFVILHECGHETLFRSRRLHRAVGHVAGFFALIPFESWKRVHGRHHKWTGWQDLDPTTTALVPRPLARAERWIVDAAWRWWIPLFSVTYRVSNYWHLSRLASLFPRADQRRRLVTNALALLVAYGGLAWLVGPEPLARLVGPALLLSLVVEDPLLLSQHTHVPLELSGGGPAAPYAAIAQEVFTRSLRFPGWVSHAVLLGFDAHELHHMYPFVPGYHLRRIRYETHNEVPWWAWLRAAKRVPGTVFLFQNRRQSGLEI
jgi:fatty acid desaturase